jgi:hypothetical protein
MSEVLTVVFTAIIAIATCVYTYFTIRLWRATKASVDVTKATVLISYLTTMAQEIDKRSITNPQEAALLQNVTMLLAQVSMGRLLEDVKMSKEPELRDTLNKLHGLMQAQGVDPQNIPWFRPVIDKMKSGD